MGKIVFEKCYVFWWGRQLSQEIVLLYRDILSKNTVFWLRKFYQKIWYTLIRKILSKIYYVSWSAGHYSWNIWGSKVQTVSQCMINATMYGTPTVPVCTSTYGASTVPVSTRTYGLPLFLFPLELMGLPLFLFPLEHMGLPLFLFPLEHMGLPLFLFPLELMGLPLFLLIQVNSFIPSTVITCTSFCSSPLTFLLSLFLCSACLSSHLQAPVLGLSLQSSPGSCARPVSPVISWFLCSACLSSHLRVPVSPVISGFLCSACLSHLHFGDGFLSLCFYQQWLQFWSWVQAAFSHGDAFVRHGDQAPLDYHGTGQITLHV